MTTQVERSFCRICHAACPVEDHINDGRATRVIGVDEDPLPSVEAVADDLLLDH